MLSRTLALMLSFSPRHVHLIGVGGINMSAVAKLLLAAGIEISASDLNMNDQIQILIDRGADIWIGEKPELIPMNTDLIIYTSAAPEKNSERLAAAERGIRQMTNFQFLGEWFADRKVILVTGTHGKSTTTAMLGSIFEAAQLDPTVIVGSKLPGFVEGNLRRGASDFVIIEGDEYARHFLEFHPYAVLLNNIELDHTDIFRDLNDMVATFRELLRNVQSDGVVVANFDDERITQLIESEIKSLKERNIKILSFGSSEHADWQVKMHFKNGQQIVTMRNGEMLETFALQVLGKFNAWNAAGAWVTGKSFEIESEIMNQALFQFKGIWRRFELLKELNGALIFSDYGHHPTAVAATLAAAREAYANRRLVLCFQPHHRNRLKHLFLDFVPSFDAADIVTLCEAYDVAGRDANADGDISSQDLVDALIRHDADRYIKRSIEYAGDPKRVIEKTLGLIQPNDVVIFMGAGDIDTILRKELGV